MKTKTTLHLCIFANGCNVIFVSSCKSYLDDGMYTWRHNLVLSYLAKSMSSIKNASLYADLPSFPSPSLITGDSLRPDLVLVLNNTNVYLLELTVGFESNIKVNSDRKAAKYHPPLTSLRTEYTNINFVNFSMLLAVLVPLQIIFCKC